MRFAKFIINGLVATGVHFSTLFVLVEVVGVPIVGLANALAAIVGITTSYLGNKFFVFGSREDVAKTLPRFLLLYATIAAMHGTFMLLWCDFARLDYRLGFLVATGLQFILSYAGNVRLVFRN